MYPEQPANVFSLHTLVSRKQHRPKTNLHVSIIHTFSSDMFGAKSIDYCLLTHGLCSLNTPGNPLHSLGVPKTGQAENTPTCVKNMHNIFFSEVGSIIWELLSTKNIFHFLND